MNKKLLISLGSLSTIAIIAPVLAITSCAGETPVEATNLIITAKANPVLTNEDVALLEATDDADNAKKWTTLGKLFEGTGFVTDNKAKFTTSINKTDNIVTLTAIKGYTIDGKEKVGSNKYTIRTEPVVTDLEITVITTSATLNTTEVAALTGSDTTAQLAALKKLFSGKDLTTENLVNFKVSVEESTRIVTLTANEGFTIGTKDKLDSTAYTLETTPTVTDLKITAKTASATLKETEVTSLTGSDTTAQLVVLAKLFEGEDLKNENLTNFKVSVETSTRIATLTAEKDFTIGGQPKLDSTAYTLDTPATTDLKITAKTTQKITAEDVVNLKGTDNSKKLISLQKLFEGDDLKIENINNFDVSVSDQNVVTLTAKDNYLINGNKTLVSPAFTIETIPTDQDLAISPKTTSADLTGIELLDVVGTDKPKQLAVLNKLFDGVDNTKQDNFTVSLGADNVITLTANKGYIFVDKNSINSPKYNVTNTNINITAEAEQKLTVAEDATINATPSTDNAAAQLVILKKLFKDITDENANYFTFTIKDKIVTLTGKTGFVFGASGTAGTATLVAPAYTVTPNDVDLGITPISASADLTGEELIDVIGTDKPKQLAVLVKLFNGVTKDNQTNFVTTLGSGDVVNLKANNGFTFNGKDTLNSSSYKVTIANLDIEADAAQKLDKAQEVLLMSQSTPENASAQMAVISKLFKGVTSTNFNYFTFKVETTKVVTLTAKQGFVFGKTVDAGKPTLVAPPYTIDTTPPPTNDINLGIRAIDPTANITTEDINNLKGTNATNKNTTFLKLFSGVTVENQNNFTFTINETAKTITLTANNGYAFGAGTAAQKNLDSQVFTEEFEKLIISANTANLNLTAEQVKAIKDATDIDKQLEALKILFFGITSAHIPNVTITIDESKTTVTLKPNYGYTLDSTEQTLTVIYTLTTV
ncbi:MAG: hypothetical protein ACRDA7_01210 [Metamycoplasmataceae bacterium]